MTIYDHIKTTMTVGTKNIASYTLLKYLEEFTGKQVDVEFDTWLNIRSAAGIYSDSEFRKMIVSLFRSYVSGLEDNKKVERFLNKEMLNIWED